MLEGYDVSYLGLARALGIPNPATSGRELTALTARLIRMAEAGEIQREDVTNWSARMCVLLVAGMALDLPGRFPLDADAVGAEWCAGIWRALGLDAAPGLAVA